MAGHSGRNDETLSAWGHWTSLMALGLPNVLKSGLIHCIWQMRHLLLLLALFYSLAALFFSRFICLRLAFYRIHKRTSLLKRFRNLILLLNFLKKP